MTDFQHDSIRSDRIALAVLDKGLGQQEKDFALAWKDEQLCFAGRTCLRLISTLDGLQPITQRDATVVATVIQWLGTNMGGALIDMVRNRAHPALQDNLTPEGGEG